MNNCHPGEGGSDGGSAERAASQARGVCGRGAGNRRMPMERPILMPRLMPRLMPMLMSLLMSLLMSMLMPMTMQVADPVYGWSDFRSLYGSRTWRWLKAALRPRYLPCHHAPTMYLPCYYPGSSSLVVRSVKTPSTGFAVRTWLLLVSYLQSRCPGHAEERHAHLHL